MCAFGEIWKNGRMPNRFMTRTKLSSVVRYGANFTPSCPITSTAKPAHAQVDTRSRADDAADPGRDAAGLQPVVDEPANEAPEADPRDQVTQGRPGQVGVGTAGALRRLVAGHDARTISVGVS